MTEAVRIGGGGGALCRGEGVVRDRAAVFAAALDVRKPLQLGMERKDVHMVPGL